MENKREREDCCLDSFPHMQEEVQEKHLVPDCAVTDFRLITHTALLCHCG